MCGGVLGGRFMNGWHIHCAKCGDVVGVWPSDLGGLAERDNIYPMIRCAGRGKHLRPNKKTVRAYWGLVEEFFFHYQETDTQEHAYRYIGPPWWPFIPLAFLFVVKREPHERFKKLRLSGKIILWLPGRWVFWKKLRKVFAL